MFAFENRNVDSLLVGSESLGFLGRYDLIAGNDGVHDATEGLDSESEGSPVTRHHTTKRA